MRKWKEYTRQERIMIVVIIVLFIAVLLSWGRVSTGITKGLDIFSRPPVDTVGQK